MKHKFLIAAAGLVASAASANTPSIIVVNDRPAARVSYADLDLASQAGRIRLEARIGRAASMLCDENGVRPLPAKLQSAECFRKAAASGQAQMTVLMAGAR